MTTHIPESGQSGKRPSVKNGEAIERLLEFEIGQLRADAAQPGWTQWALLGTLGALFWVALDELGKGPVRLHSIAYILVAYYLVIDTWYALQQLLGIRGGTEMFGSRFVSLTPHARALRALILVEILRSGVVIWLSMTAGGYMNYAVYLLTQMIYIVLLVMFTLSLGYVGANVPLPVLQSADTRRFVYLDIAVALLMLGTTIGVLVPLITGVVPLMLDDLRLAGVLVAVLTVFSILASLQQSRSPFLQVLVDIRRSLALGEVTSEEARKKTEVALVGLTLADVLQDDLAKILLHLGGISRRIEDATRSVEEISILVTDMGDGGDGSWAAAVDLRGHLSAVERALAGLDDDVKASAKLIDPFYQKLKVISTLMRRTLSEMPPFTESIKTSIRDIAEKLEELKRKRSELAALAESTLGRLSAE